MSLGTFDRFERLLDTDLLVSRQQSLWQEPESFLATHLLGKVYFFASSYSFVDAVPFNSPRYLAISF
jgi:hypothetical protein